MLVLGPRAADSVKGRRSGRTEAKGARGQRAAGRLPSGYLPFGPFQWCQWPTCDRVSQSLPSSCLSSQSSPSCSQRSRRLAQGPAATAVRLYLPPLRFYLCSCTCRPPLKGRPAPDPPAAGPWGVAQLPRGQGRHSRLLVTAANVHLSAGRLDPLHPRGRSRRW